MLEQCFFLLHGDLTATKKKKRKKVPRELHTSAFADVGRPLQDVEPVGTLTQCGEFFSHNLVWKPYYYKYKQYSLKTKNITFKTSRKTFIPRLFSLVFFVLLTE